MYELSFIRAHVQTEHSWMNKKYYYQNHILDLNTEEHSQAFILLCA